MYLGVDKKFPEEGIGIKNDEDDESLKEADRVRERIKEGKEWLLRNEERNELVT